MAMNTVSQPCGMDKTGSFFKLVDALASELERLEQDMVYTASQRYTREPEASLLHDVEGEVSGVYLQYPLVGGPCESENVSKRISAQERVTLTHPIWLLLSVTEQEATRILLQQPVGVFLVRRSSALQKKVLSLRVDNTPGSPIIHYPLEESLFTFSLEGSGISFADLFRLVTFYCISRDILPFPLRLPEAINSARTLSELEEVAKLGAGFWDVALCRKWDTLSHSCLLVQNELPNSLHCELSVIRRQSQTLSSCRARHNQRCTPLSLAHTCSISADGKSSSSEALCFFNPLFLQTHQRHTGNSIRAASKDVSEPNSKEASNKSQPSPPPRPPPPRCLPCHPGQKRISVTAAYARTNQSPAQKHEPTSTMGPKHSSPKRFPAPPPPQQKQSGTDSHHCGIALDDQNMARALYPASNAHKEPSTCTVTNILQHCSGKAELSQGSSDLSTFTSSSDSLDSPPHPLHFDRFLSPDQSLSTDNSSDEDKEEKEADDYGAGLQRDLQLRLRASQNSRKLLMMEDMEVHSGSLLILPRALKGHFRKVRGVLGVLPTPERRALRRIVELSRNKSSYFGCLVQDYVSFVQENHSCHMSGLDLLQTVRQFMTQMKAYLMQASDLNPPIESLIPEDQIDVVLERAMHKCVLKPLHGSVYAALHKFQVSSGVWQRLQENLAIAKSKQPGELGADTVRSPDLHAIKRIRLKLRSMCKMYSPERKIKVLLHVCKLIYTDMQNRSGRSFGADDFLPMLTYVLAQCDMPQLDTEVQYMMELLDPSLLHGEGGYYLTSACGAMSLIKNFQEDQAACVLSSATRSTLHQWHQRRTIQRNLPSVDDFQNFLRVALQEADSGCTAKTLQVHPNNTTEEVSRLCAHKFHVTDPENYALFLITDDCSQQLAPDTYPQWIKAEFQSRPHPKAFYFVYRRLPNPNGCKPSQSHNSSCTED
ncbi:ras and Rab interactor 2 isoform X2 [Electrophorus electricus]|uniref:ras and Rab interactor 2 isoform X2 n=1 Tax=Electrophorus electricus TaxID=8005 RepID=UPI0015D03147|nr:ras and Rab interactor 2 isoform X2 [Electrophorus electricus]